MHSSWLEEQYANPDRGAQVKHQTPTLTHATPTATHTAAGLTRTPTNDAGRVRAFAVRRPLRFPALPPRCSHRTAPEPTSSANPTPDFAAIDELVDDLTGPAAVIVPRPRTATDRDTA